MLVFVLLEARSWLQIGFAASSHQNDGLVCK